MGRRNMCRTRLIPQQDKRICGSICFCQMVAVFSGVSLIYLTVAIYIPSYKAFHSGFEIQPIMCQTVNTSMINNCSWASCGEWCLTKTSGYCPQIHVTARQNGTTLQFQNCRNISLIPCPPARPQDLKKYNCNNGSVCSSLSGIFNCSLGHCSNMSEIFQCYPKIEGGVKLDSDKENIKLTGFFECHDSKCIKIKKPFYCDRYCDIITTGSTNVYISMDDTLYTAACESAVALTETNGSFPGHSITEQTIWEAELDRVLMLSCYSVRESEEILHATDCVNGTLYRRRDIPYDSMNFTTFWKIRNRWREVLDPYQVHVPMQSTLTIYNYSRLYINLEGCVNTLRGECHDFHLSNGRDGKNQTAQSRFPCYYKKNNSFMVIARYDLNKTKKQLIIAVSAPAVLFLVSFITLCIVMQSVKVGDDTKMRCKYCIGNTEPSDAADTARCAFNKYEPDDLACGDDAPLQRHND